MSSHTFSSINISPALKYINVGIAGAPHFCYGSDGKVLEYESEKQSPYIDYKCHTIEHEYSYGNIDEYNSTFHQPILSYRVLVYLAVYYEIDLIHCDHRISVLPLITKSKNGPWNHLVPGTGYIPPAYTKIFNLDGTALSLAITDDVLRVYHELRDRIAVFLATGYTGFN